MHRMPGIMTAAYGAPMLPDDYNPKSPFQAPLPPSPWTYPMPASGEQKLQTVKIRVVTHLTEDGTLKLKMYADDELIAETEAEKATTLSLTAEV